MYLKVTLTCVVSTEARAGINCTAVRPGAVSKETQVTVACKRVKNKITFKN